MKDIVLGKDKCLVRNKSSMIDGWEEAQSLEELMRHCYADAAEKPVPQWIGSKIPADLMKQVLATIKEFPSMEVAFTLYYNPGDKTWKVKCPEQRGGAASVRFKDDGDGFVTHIMVGSIHTHPEMHAFWSGTDSHDQVGSNGLHIVFGLKNGLVNETKATLFTKLGAYDQQWADVCELDNLQESLGEPVSDWVYQIKKQSYKDEIVHQYPVWTKPDCHHPDKDKNKDLYDSWKYRTPWRDEAGKRRFMSLTEEFFSEYLGAGADDSESESDAADLERHEWALEASASLTDEQRLALFEALLSDLVGTGNSSVLQEVDTFLEDYGWFRDEELDASGYYGFPEIPCEPGEPKKSKEDRECSMFT